MTYVPTAFGRGLMGGGTSVAATLDAAAEAADADVQVWLSTNTVSGGSKLTPLGQLVDRATYKPGWVIEVREHDAAWGGSGELLIHANVPDSYHPNNKIKVSHAFYFRGGEVPDEAAALSFLEVCVQKVERHEAREFLRIDGEVVNPPGHGVNDPYR